jgi:hypothetical protein
MLDGLVMAMRGYFDDSGTHAGSKMVVYAGVIGRVAQWDAFEQAWRAVLAERGLEHFHMVDCEAGADPYFHPRAWRDALIGDLRRVIMDARLGGIGVAIPTEPWAELITGPLLPLFGGPADACIAICINQAIKICEPRDPDPLALIFDGGMERNALASLSHAGAAFNETRGRVDVISMMPVKSLPGLQAADMLAWEMRRDALAYATEGEGRAIRPHFFNWATSGRIDGSLITRENLLEMIEEEKALNPNLSPDFWKSAAPKSA